MSRDTVYWQLWKANNGYRYKIELTPSKAGGAALPAGFVREQIPTKVFLKQMESETSFDKLPIGVAEPMAIDLRLRFDALPTHLQEILLRFNSGEFFEPITRFKIPLLNFWVISCDFGDTALAPDDFPVLFQGVQKRGMEQKIECLPDGRRYFNVSLEHATKFAISCMTFENIANLGLGQVDVSSIYEYNYTDSSGGAVIKAVTCNPPAKFLSLANLWDSVENMINDFVMAILMRRYDNPPFGVPEDSGFAMDFEIPHTFYEQAATVNNVAGAAVVANDLSFCLTLKVNTSEGEKLVGGRFGNPENLWFKEYNNAWDFLKKMCENFFVKARLRPVLGAEGYVDTFETAPVFGAFGAATTGAVTLGDWIGKYDYTLAGNTIRVGKCESVDVASDKDISDAKFLQAGNDNEVDYNLDVLLHNLPSLHFVNDCALYHELTRIHDTVTLTNGITSYTSPPTGDPLPEGESDPDLKESLFNGATVNIQQKSGLPLALATFLVKNFGKSTSAIVSGRVNMREDLSPLMVGDVYNVELGTAEAAVSGSVGVLLSARANFVTGKMDVTFFMLGT